MDLSTDANLDLHLGLIVDCLDDRQAVAIEVASIRL